MKISLLGSMQVLNGGDSAEFRTDAERILFAYLAAHQGTLLRRDSLAHLLSPDRPDKEALTYLRNRLTRLRSAIGDNDASPPWLLIDRKQIGLRNGSDITIDVMTFDTLLAAVDMHPHRELAGCAVCLDRLRQAVALYRGELLTGLNFPSETWEGWLLGQREHYQQAALEAMTLLRDALIERGEWDEVLAIALRQLSAESWLEAAHRAVMMAHAHLGDRAAAIAQFEQCKQLLWDELGVAPELETAELLGRLKGEGRRMKEEKIPHFSSTVPDNLPVQMSPFFGRESEKAQVLELLVDPNHRLVTLVGAGGIGKTRLSLEVAQAVKASFPDGVWFVGMADKEEGAERLKIAVGEAVGLNADADGKQLSGDQVIAILRDKRMLLIFDNSEVVLEALSFVPQWLQRAPGIAILASSREPLNFEMESVVLLEGLPLDVAEALFAERGKKARADFLVSAENQPPVQQICSMVGGSPLGIALAAAWLRRRSLAQIISSINESLDFLSSRMRDIDPRHRSMRAVFETSWQLLAPEEQVVFAALSVFPGTFSEEAAAAIGGAALFDLDALCEKSLLVQQQEQERYAMHGLIRQFAMEKLRKGGNSAEIDHAFVDFFYHYVGANQQDYAALAPEWGNFSAGIVKAYALAAWPLVLDFVWVLDEPWYRQARFTDMREGLAYALEAAKVMRNEVAFAQTLLRLGEIEMEQNAYVSAETHLEHAMNQFMRLENSPGIAKSKFSLGRIKSENAQFDEALALFEDSKRIFEGEGDDLGVARNLNYIAGCLIRKSRDMTLAETYLLQSEQRQADETSSSYIETLRFLARVKLQTGKFEEADTLLTQAKALSEAMGDSGETSAISFELVDLYRRTGRYELGLKLGLDCLEQFKSVGSLRWEGLIKTQLGLLNQLTNSFELAAEYLTDSLKIFEEIDDRYEQSYGHYYLYKLHAEAGNIGLASRAGDAARRLSFELGDTLLQGLLENTL